jgi:hypothetical protein
MTAPLYCTASWAGPGADGNETTPPVVYILLTDQAGSWKGAQWFYAAANAKDEMLAVALAAISQGLTVAAFLDPPNAAGEPYTEIHSLYLTNGQIPGV